MTAILGISAFYHDSAAALVVDGDIVAAAQEERFTRKKHDPGFPANAIDYCLKEGGIGPEALDYIAFYDKPLTKFDRLLETYLAYAPAGFRSFRMAMPLWLKDKLHMRRTLRQRLTAARRARLVFTDHHESHAASAFFPSPFDRAAVLTLDGVGEWSTATFGVGEGNKVRLLRQLQFPHSLGLLYSAFTYYCGFKVNSGEYKLMGLAPYGQPVYHDLILKHLIRLQPDGSFWMDMDYFNYCQGLTMTNDRFHRLFGGGPRSPESLLEQRHMDLAASIQKVTEEIMLSMAREVQRQTQMKNLVLAGGVALNCVANGRLLREGIFKDIWIQPAAGDAGGALGAAYVVWHEVERQPRTADNVHDRMRHTSLGPLFDDAQIEAYLKAKGYPAEKFADPSKWADRIAELIASERVVGLLQGRMEFGPRALGNRSIIGDARSPKMQSIMNLKIKYRESFRPFAPVCLVERTRDYFELDRPSPYMLLVAQVQSARCTGMAEAQTLPIRERINQVRSDVPAITHVDYSARVQTVAPDNVAFYGIVKAFEARTGCGVIINTSFNVRGEPIVCTPEDAYRCFMRTEMDTLVLGSFILDKNAQPPWQDKGNWKQDYVMD